MTETVGSSCPPATVVITTKNRVEDLRQAVASALAQSVSPEVIVVDDGSTDGTSEAMSREFPEVRVHREDQSRGYIAQRNRGARLAKSPIIFSIDDDAVFSSARVVEQTLREFDHPRVGAVAIPFIDVNRSPEIKQRAPAAEDVFVGYSFIGTAHALRRELFLQLGGYRELLIHQGEEEDYCARMLAAGFVTRLGTADPIHHFESPRRNWTRMDYYGSRNKILYSWWNVPLPFFPGHLAMTTAKTLTYCLHPGRFVTRLRGVLAGWSLGMSGRLGRHPVSPSTYRLSRALKRRGATPIAEIEGSLGPGLRSPDFDFSKA